LVINIQSIHDTRSEKHQVILLQFNRCHSADISTYWKV